MTKNSPEKEQPDYSRIQTETIKSMFHELLRQESNYLDAEKSLFNRSSGLIMLNWVFFILVFKKEIIPKYFPGWLILIPLLGIISLICASIPLIVVSYKTQKFIIGPLPQKMLEKFWDSDEIKFIYEQCSLAKDRIMDKRKTNRKCSKCYTCGFIFSITHIISQFLIYLIYIFK